MAVSNVFVFFFYCFRMIRRLPWKYLGWSCSCKRHWVSVECLRWRLRNSPMIWRELNLKETRYRLLVLALYTVQVKEFTLLLFFLAFCKFCLKNEILKQYRSETFFVC